MRRVLSSAALALAVAGLAAWILTGAHPGWSRTSVPVQKTDEVTGLNYTEYEPRWVMGVELLAGALGLSGLLFGGSRLIRNRTASSP